MTKDFPNPFLLGNNQHVIWPKEFDKTWENKFIIKYMYTNVIHSWLVKQTRKRTFTNYAIELCNKFYSAS